MPARSPGAEPSVNALAVQRIDARHRTASPALHRAAGQAAPRGRAYSAPATPTSRWSRPGTPAPVWCSSVPPSATLILLEAAADAQQRHALLRPAVHQGPASASRAGSSGRLGRPPPGRNARDGRWTASRSAARHRPAPAGRRSVPASGGNITGCARHPSPCTARVLVASSR